MRNVGSILLLRIAITLACAVTTTDPSRAAVKEISGARGRVSRVPPTEQPQKYTHTSGLQRNQSRRTASHSAHEPPPRPAAGH